jgi:hypothetical protein
VASCDCVLGYRRPNAGVLLGDLWISSLRQDMDRDGCRGIDGRVTYIFDGDCLEQAARHDHQRLYDRTVALVYDR